MPLSDAPLLAPNNETLGMTVEKVLCDLAGLDGSELASRSLASYEERMRPTLRAAMDELPRFVRHVGKEAGTRGGHSKSPVDFLLEKDLTLSSKATLKRGKAKVCPSEMGQPGMQTYALHFAHLYDPEELVDGVVPPSVFKRTAQTRIADKMSTYFEHLFDCDILLWSWLQPTPGHLIFRREDVPAMAWDPDRFGFTKTPDVWGESCTVKYRFEDRDSGEEETLSIGEFQVHEHRANYKFRFNLPNLHRVMQAAHREH